MLRWQRNQGTNNDNADFNELEILWLACDIPMAASEEGHMLGKAPISLLTLREVSTTVDGTTPTKIYNAYCNTSLKFWPLQHTMFRNFLPALLLFSKGHLFCSHNATPRNLWNNGSNSSANGNVSEMYLLLWRHVIWRGRIPDAFTKHIPLKDTPELRPPC